MINKLCFAALLLAAACASDNSQASSVVAASSGGGGGASGSSKPSGSSSGKQGAANGSAMTVATAAKGTYQAAFEAYRAFAAQKLGVAPDKVAGVGPNENIAKLQRGRVGQVWAFEAHPKDAMTPEARGWASNDGVVITLEQNLGLLFAEAGVWGGGVSPALTAPQLADALTWAMGSGHNVFTLHPKVPAPELKLKDGEGSLVFHVDLQQPGSRGPRNVSRVEVTLAKDHRATLARAPIPAP